MCYTIGAKYITLVLNSQCNIQVNLFYIVSETSVTQNVTLVTLVYE